MVNLKEPTNKKELRSALGLFSYYRKFIKNFAQITRPLFDLIKDVPYVKFRAKPIYYAQSESET